MAYKRQERIPKSRLQSLATIRTIGPPMNHELIAIATRFLEDTGNPDPSSDALALALCCGWELCPVTNGAGPVRLGYAHTILRDGSLYYAASADRPAVQLAVAMEVARFALRREGCHADRVYHDAESLARLLVSLD